MGKPIGEVELKGKSIDEHLESEEGRGLLRWLIQQPIKEDSFKGWTLGRNSYIKERLDLHKTDPGNTEEQTKKDVTVAPKQSEQVVTTLLQTILQTMLQTLQQIEKNQRLLMGKEGIVWDED